MRGKIFDYVAEGKQLNGIHSVFFWFSLFVFRINHCQLIVYQGSENLKAFDVHFQLCVLVK